jgi:hypothetical protein
MRILPLAGLLWAAQGWATPALESAKAEFKALRYPQAEKALKDVLSATGLSRAEVLELYELQALLAAGANRGADAREAFVALLTLDPEYKLKGKPSPRVTTPFFEARAQVKEQGALTISSEGQPTAERVGTVRVTARGRTAQVRAIRAEVTEGAETHSVGLPPEGGQLVVSSRAATVTIKVLGSLDWTLLEPPPARFESPSAPAPGPVVTVAPVAAPPPPPPVVVETPQAAPLVHPAAWVLGGAGVAALIVGAVFGSQGVAARMQAESGAVSRAEALDLSTRAVRDSTIANVFFVSGGVALAGGVVALLLGLPPAKGLALVPMPGGGLLATASLPW